jgi:hypothetical protein
MPSSSTRYAERDKAVLRHIALYGIGLPAVISRVFMASKQAGHVLNRFAESSGPLVRFPRSLPGGLSYYRLSGRGVALLSTPKDRAEPLGEVALDLAIGVSFFCCMGPSRRYRVERKELLPFFGDRDTPQGNVPHVLSDESGEAILYRVYQAQGADSHTVQRVREHVAATRATPSIKPFLENGLYGFAILVPTSEKLKPIETAIRRHDLQALAPIVVGVGPTASTLAQELRKVRS